MTTIPFLRATAPLVGLGLLLGACSSSGSDTASGGDASTTTAASSSDGDGGSSGGTGRDVCAAVTPEQVAEILGQEVTGAEALSVEDTMRSRSDAEGCNYLGEPMAGADTNVVTAEFMPCDEVQGILTDPVFERVEVSGLGDEAKGRPGMSMETGELDPESLIDVAVVDGDTCLYVRMFQGATPAQTKALGEALLAS